MVNNIKNKKVKKMMIDSIMSCKYYSATLLTPRQERLSLSWQFNVCGIFWNDYGGESVVVSLTADQLRSK